MPLKLVPTSQFKKDLKRIRKRGYDLDALEIVLDKLCACQPLENRNHDHALSGNYVGFRECHIKPDWLLIYLIEDDILTLTLADTGSHADLFKM